MKIVPGDLVMITRVAKCGCPVFIGRPFRVGAIKTVYATVCPFCRDIQTFPHEYAYQLDGNYGAGVWRLKRLDHDALKDDVPTGEEIMI